MDVATFVTIPLLLPKPADSRLQYGSSKRAVVVDTEEGSIVIPGAATVAILLHGPAGTVDLMWQKPAESAERTMRHFGVTLPWYEIGALSLGWHSRTPRNSECRNPACKVFENGPYGVGECWHDWTYCEGQQYGPIIDASQWVKMGDMLETFYRRCA